MLFLHLELNFINLKTFLRRCKASSVKSKGPVHECFHCVSCQVEFSAEVSCRVDINFISTCKILNVKLRAG